MSFLPLYYADCLPFIQKTLNRPLGSVQQDFFATLRNVYQTFGVTVWQFTKRLNVCVESQKEGEPSISLELGHLKLKKHGVLKGLGLQIFQ